MSARTLGWVLSRGPARWCAALGARSPALSRREPEPGRAAAPAPPPASQEKSKGKSGGKATGGGAGGGGREPPVPGRKFHGRGRGVLFPHSRPPPQIIWKLLPTSSGTSDTVLHFQADKALSRESPGCPLGSGKGPREPISPRLPPDPAPIHTSVSVPAGHRAAGAAGRAAEHRHSRERGLSSPRRKPRIYI